MLTKMSIISKTVQDRLKVSMEGKYETGHDLSNGTIAVDPGVTVDLDSRGQRSPKRLSLITRKRLQLGAKCL